MLRTISWSQFLTNLTGALLVYYAVLAFTHYRAHRYLISRLSGGVRPRPKQAVGVQAKVPENLFDLASGLATEIKSTIQDAVSRNLVPDEMLQSIQRVLKNYSKLVDTGFQTEINRVIEKNCKKDCLIALTDDELNMLWSS
jgi:hypothetical protein